MISEKAKEQNFAARVLNPPTVLMRHAKSDCSRRRISGLETRFGGGVCEDFA
jgi:hypothetical protein